MARKPLYPEGSENLNIHIPTPLKDAIQEAAQEERQSASQLIVLILDDWLRQREREEVPA